MDRLSEIKERWLPGGSYSHIGDDLAWLIEALEESWRAQERLRSNLERLTEAADILRADNERLRGVFQPWHLEALERDFKARGTLPAVTIKVLLGMIRELVFTAEAPDRGSSAGGGRRWQGGTPVGLDDPDEMPGEEEVCPHGNPYDPTNSYPGANYDCCYQAPKVSKNTSPVDMVVETPFGSKIVRPGESITIDYHAGHLVNGRDCFDCDEDIDYPPREGSDD